MNKKFTGNVLSGTGRGAKFISLPIYEEIFEELLGEKPFYGTLNLQVDQDEAEIITKEFKNGNVFEDLEYKGEEYGAIITIDVSIICNGDEIQAVGVRPLLTTHDTDVIELVSHKHLRECLDLKDGDVVKFEII